MTLEKAKLTNVNKTGDVIEFMFNPKELAFEGQAENNENSGSRNDKTGKPKVSFSNIQSYKISIHNVLFDTYEAGTDVLKQHINYFKDAVKFEQDKSRPPVYRFSWGGKEYFKYCFVEKLSYKITMFLPNGLPVRAVIDNLTLKEVDGPDPEKTKAPEPEADRKNDNPAARKKNSKSTSKR
jgi:hypothetical protein